MLSPLLIAFSVACLVVLITGFRKAMRQHRITMQRIDAASHYLMSVSNNAYAWARQQMAEGNFDLNPVLRSADAVWIRDMMKEPWKPFPEYFAGTLVEAEGLLPDD